MRGPSLGDQLSRHLASPKLYHRAPPSSLAYHHPTSFLNLTLPPAASTSLMLTFCAPLRLPITITLCSIIPTGPSVSSATTTSASAPQGIFLQLLYQMRSDLRKFTQSSPIDQVLLSSHICFICCNKHILFSLVSPGCNTLDLF